MAFDGRLNRSSMLLPRLTLAINTHLPFINTAVRRSEQYTDPTPPPPWLMHNSIARCKYHIIHDAFSTPAVFVLAWPIVQQYQTPQQPRPNLQEALEADLLNSSDLLRRLNPRDTKKNLQSITTIVPDLTEDLLSSVDQPLEIRRCPQTNRDYLLCDYNRDGDSYRSPWSNEFDPPLEDGTVPSERVRKLEIAANDAFDVYRDLYYEGGVGSVYFWDLDDGFAGVVLLKKGVYISGLIWTNPEHSGD